jgi:hypothetical protein
MISDAAVLRLWKRHAGPNPNMSFTEFRQELRDMTDPTKAMSTLGDMQLMKARERMNRMRIDRARKGHD